MKTKTMLMFFAILLTLSAVLPMAFATIPSWTLVDSNPDPVYWRTLSVPYWYDFIDFGEPFGDRTFEYEYDLTAHNFGKFTTELKMDNLMQTGSGNPTTFANYWIMLSGTSKNTQETVEFGWRVELERYHCIPYPWRWRYDFWRIDQNGQETNIGFSDYFENRMIDIKMECEKTGGTNWWTKVTFTQGAYELENYIFDYIDKPTITREYEHPQIEYPTWCKGWSTTGAVISYPTLTVSKQGQGTVTPDLGKYRLHAGTEIEFEATETVQYWIFDYWLVNGQQSEENPITVELGMVSTLVAKFAVTGGGGECPMTYSWNGTDLIYEGLVPIHDPDGEDVIGSLDITGDVVTEGDFYKFRLEEYPTTESFLDQVQLYGVKENGNEKLLSLASAEHSRYGDVLSEILNSDDVRVNIDGWEHCGYAHFDDTIDLLFDAGSGEYESFRIQIEGHNIEFKQ